MGFLAAQPWTELLSIWAFFALNVLTPGPNVFNTIGIALGSGRGPALAAAAGVAPGVMLWGTAATLGAATLFALWPAAETALTLLGAGLLLLFGSRYIRRALATGPGAVKARAGATPLRAFMATLAVLATNPKALTTWLVILSLFPAAQASTGTLALLVVGMASVGTLMHVGYALLFSTRAAAAVYARAARGVDAAVGLFFMGLGLRLIAGRAGVW
ncbi:LysE family translocator [Rubrimonas cliftonensis]|uniref:Threonine/homoserine/homoserine lactone efflux protein n=1 Tax=Rubrimonas cliftonensis TaxID=89524 RepID=A0A1H4FLW3_9RHOB|nr:LysE family transporter [Rubrimonas cliftonensis]SEA98284.1 Threonine/homoserine/homoserine lactone efflux protein [Rubrimonas cliftonensis]